MAKFNVGEVVMAQRRGKSPVEAEIVEVLSEPYRGEQGYRIYVPCLVSPAPSGLWRQRESKLFRKPPVVTWEKCVWCPKGVKA